MIAEKFIPSSEIVVIGAGIAGVMTALNLRRKGHRVTLMDRWAPGHSRASSTDYTRLFRSAHGSDRMYTVWSRDARLAWIDLQAELGMTLYLECGALILAEAGNSSWEDATIPIFDELNVPYTKLDPDDLSLHFPQFSTRNLAYGIYEPEAGAVMAHRTIIQTVQLFEREGGRVLRKHVKTNEQEQLVVDGRLLEADLIVVCAGPWLRDLYPRTVGPILEVVRQNIIYTSTPDASTAYDADNMPCWIDHGLSAYGAPSVDGNGVKAAIYWTDAIIDLDNDDRIVDQATFVRTKIYLERRFPGLVGQKAIDQKACQISMTPDTHFIVDFHPKYANVLIVGGCSGHLFKHGPVLGEFAAGVGLKEFGTAERFKLGTRTQLGLSESPSGR